MPSNLGSTGRSPVAVCLAQPQSSNQPYSLAMRKKGHKGSASRDFFFFPVVLALSINLMHQTATPSSMTSRQRRMPLWAKIPLGILLWPYLVFYVLNCRQRERRRERRAAIRKLPRHRKRALTLPLPDRTLCFKTQRAYDQLQSPLFNRIVWDVRQLIYEYVLAPDERELHLGKTEGRLCSICCHSAESTQETWQHEYWQPHHIDLAEYFARPLPQRSSKCCSANLIGLLLSCRQMLVYSTNSTIPSRFIYLTVSDTPSQLLSFVREIGSTYDKPE